jgi:hypothetical protein
MGHTKKRLIAYGAQFESHISVMRAHNSDWCIVPKQLDCSSSSSLCEVFLLTGHEGYVSSVQFFAQDKVGGGGGGGGGDAGDAGDAGCRRGVGGGGGGGGGGG